VYEPLAFPYAGVVVGVANEVDDRDWRKLPLIERKEILRDIVPADAISSPPYANKTSKGS
jgi:hypothetical protein